MLRLVRPGNESFLAAVEQHFKDRMLNARRLLELLPADSRTFTFEVLLLCCCALDAMAGLFLIDDAGMEYDKERFQELLWRFGATQDFRFDWVNMIALQKEIDEFAAKHGLAIPSVKAYVQAEIEKHDYACGSCIRLDLPCEDVGTSLRPLLKQDSGMQHWSWLENAIRDSTHAGVLYRKYRCSAVHELLVRGHWSSDQEDSQPFYMPVTGDGVDFTFPAIFLIELVERILVGTLRLANPITTGL